MTMLDLFTEEKVGLMLKKSINQDVKILIHSNTLQD